MAEARTEVKRSANKNYIDIFSSLSALIRDNCRVGIDLTGVLWEENLKLFDAQAKIFSDIQDEAHKYVNVGSAIPNRFLDLQGDYFSSSKSLSEKVSRDMIDFTRKAIERNFALVDDCLKLLRK